MKIWSWSARGMAMVAAVAGAGVVAGCYSYKPASGAFRTEQPAPLDAAVWPRSIDPRLAELRDKTAYAEDAIFFLIDDESLDVQTGEGTDRLVPGAKVSVNREPLDVLANDLSEYGLLRVWEPQERVQGAASLSADSLFSGMTDRHAAPPIVAANGFFLTDRELEYVDEAAAGISLAHRDMNAGEDEMSFGAQVLLQNRAHFGQPIDATRRYSHDELLLEEGHAVGLPGSVPDEPRGLMVYIPGTIPTKYERPLLERLEDSGWAIVYVDSSLGVRQPPGNGESEAQSERAQIELKRILKAQEIDAIGPPPPDGAAEEDVRAYRAARSAFQRTQDSDGSVRRAAEVTRERYPEPAGAFMVEQARDLETLAGTIARSSDLLFAEHALAAEAVVRWMYREHPSLAGKPMIVIGFSAGAIAAPTITARLHELFPATRMALVMVGGGGDALSITANSQFSDGGIKLWEDDAQRDDAVLNTLTDLYRERSTLGPLRAARAIRDVPVLHVYADNDDWVPTGAAEAFNGAHGRVDRLIYSGGHGGLFYFLPGQAGRIARWIEDAVETGRE